LENVAPVAKPYQVTLL